jgi:hypothetical protein
MSHTKFESLKNVLNEKTEDKKIKIDEDIIQLYECAFQNDLNEIKKIVNKIKEQNINDNNKIQEWNNLYLNQLVGIASEYGYVEMLEYIHFDLYFQLDSFQMFLIAAENSQLNVIKWGIDNEYEFLPHHILHAIRNGQLAVLHFAIDNAFEDDIPLFFSEGFIRNAIQYKQFEIIEFYEQNGVDISLYQNEEEEEENINKYKE